MDVVFLLSKDPLTEHGGDIALSRLVMSLAEESASVRSVALSREAAPAPPGSGVIRVAKPPVSPARLAAGRLSGGRSIVHARYAVPAFARALDALRPDRFAAEHNYMVEPYLLSEHAGRTPLLLNTVNPESEVWRVTRGWLGRMDADRILEDELRTGRAARAIGTYDRAEAELYRRNGSPTARWLDISLPPARRAPVEETGPRLVFLGDRTWPPNQEAFELLLQWWPAIAEGVPGAELVVVGRPSPTGRRRPLPAGVRDLGFAPDLDVVLDGARALLAPVMTGGGVRVKLLEAASRGLPIVATSPALGSLDTTFGLAPAADRSAFVESARRYLLDRGAAVSESRRLHDRNVMRWASGVPHHCIEEWLRA